MLDRDGAQIIITGRGRLWAAHYELNNLAGPRLLEHRGTPLLNSCCCCFNDQDDTVALAEAVRASRKGKAAIISGAGRLPSGVGLSHTHRYAEGFARFVTDVKVPRATVLKTRVSIGSLELTGDFPAWRLLDENCRLTKWEELGETPLTWPRHPPALILRRSDGLEVEIGLGNDLWRWASGLRPGTDNQGHYELRRSGAGVVFERSPSVAAVEFTPRPRSYRFSWYLAWSLDPETYPPAGGSALEPRWRPNGDLDLGALRQTLKSEPGGILELDLARMAWPDSLRRQTSPHPCLASKNVRKRLRRIVRQLAAFEPGEFPIRFRGLSPGLCDRASHLERRGQRQHWDMAAILEFALWTRQCLGDDRLILNDAGDLDCPSQQNLFAVSDHDVEPVTYEYLPPAPQS